MKPEPSSPPLTGNLVIYFLCMCWWVRLLAIWLFVSCCTLWFIWTVRPRMMRNSSWLFYILNNVHFVHQYNYRYIWGPLSKMRHPQANIWNVWWYDVLAHRAFMPWSCDIKFFIIIFTREGMEPTGVKMKSSGGTWIGFGFQLLLQNPETHPGTAKWALQKTFCKNSLLLDR